METMRVWEATEHTGWIKPTKGGRREKTAEDRALSMLRLKGQAEKLSQSETKGKKQSEWKEQKHMSIGKTKEKKEK